VRFLKPIHSKIAAFAAPQIFPRRTKSAIASIFGERYLFEKRKKKKKKKTKTKKAKQTCLDRESDKRSAPQCKQLRSALCSSKDEENREPKTTRKKKLHKKFLLLILAHLTHAHQFNGQNMLYVFHDLQNFESTKKKCSVFFFPITRRALRAAHPPMLT
jgi:FtsZ-interacting cell division protein ZipA